MSKRISGESPTPTLYAVICPEHGRVFLTEREHDRQFRAEWAWTCPRRRQYGHECGKASRFVPAAVHQPACPKCGQRFDSAIEGGADADGQQLCAVCFEGD